MSRPPADRSHLSIGEVLSLLQDEFPDVTISKIRFLESQGLLDPERTPSGYRKFYDGDIDRLRWILRQQKEHYLPLKVIKDRLDDREGQGALPLSAPGAGAFTDDRTAAAAVNGSGRAGLAVDERPDGAVAPEAREAPGRDPYEAGDPPGGPPGGRGRERRPAPGAGPGASDGMGVGGRSGDRAGDGGGVGAADAAPRAWRDAPGPAAAPAGDADWADVPVTEPRQWAGGAVDAAADGARAPGAAKAAGTPSPGMRERGPRGPEDGAAGAAGLAVTGPGRGARSPVTGGAGPAAEGPESRAGVSLTIDELAEASGMQVRDLRELEQFGLLESHIVGDAAYYDGDALVVARTAGGFLRHGIEARHLRSYKVAVDREAGLFEQIVLPLLKQRNPQAHRRASQIMAELIQLGEAMRGTLLRRELRDHID